MRMLCHVLIYVYAIGPYLQQEGGGVLYAVWVCCPHDQGSLVYQDVRRLQCGGPGENEAASTTGGPSHG